MRSTPARALLLGLLVPPLALLSALAGGPNAINPLTAGAAPAGGGPSGGPVLLAGIDAEDGGVDGHGPISVYVDLVEGVLANVTNGSTGLLCWVAASPPTTSRSSGTRSPAWPA